MAGGLLSCGMRTLSCSMHVGSSSLARDKTRAPCTGSVESHPLPHQGSPQFSCFKKTRGFPGGAVVESLPANAGDTGSSPGLGRSHMPRSN